MFSLTGHSAMVTGSSSGIGREIALALAKQGADVIIHYAKSQTRALNVVSEIKSLGKEAALIQADLEDPSNYQRLVDQVFETFPKLNIWVNNAGVDLLTGSQKELSYELKLQKLLDIDVRSTVLLSHLASKKMIAGSSILNIGWDQAETGMEGASGELFACAKNAIMGFTRSLAKSLAPEIRVNCIAPGWIKTAWGDTASDVWQERVLRETPLKRWGTPQDIAQTAVYLVSTEASFITGQIINVNGGAVC